MTSSTNILRRDAASIAHESPRWVAALLVDLAQRQPALDVDEREALAGLWAVLAGPPDLASAWQCALPLLEAHTRTGQALACEILLTGVCWVLARATWRAHEPVTPAELHEFRQHVDSVPFMARSLAVLGEVLPGCSPAACTALEMAFNALSCQPVDIGAAVRAITAGLHACEQVPEAELPGLQLLCACAWVLERISEDDAASQMTQH